MDPGKLDTLVSLQAVTAAQDSIGQPVKTRAEIGKIWVNMAHLSGLETIRTGAETSVVKVSMRCRRRADITTAMFIVHDADVYSIKATLPDRNSKAHMFLTCELAK